MSGACEARGMYDGRHQCHKCGAIWNSGQDPYCMRNPVKPAADKKHEHYFKDVTHLTSIDVYRVLGLFNVTDQAIGHATKKLICAGIRGAKDIDKDIQEAIDTLVRWQAMRAEDRRSA